MKPHGKDIRTAQKGVELQHRHFAFIAATIAAMPRNARESVAETFADACARTNANFNRSRFIAACQVTAE